jgi:hypothetical protein
MVGWAVPWVERIGNGGLLEMAAHSSETLNSTSSP